MTIDLFQRSLQIILENQHASGAYPACPNFPTYRYCWYRDGSFIAHAMSLVGQSESAARFHDWAAQTVLRRSDLVERALEKVGRGASLGGEDILHTRYTLTGEVSSEEWANFQLDGFGTWLWALDEYCRKNQVEPPEPWRQAAALVAKYLVGLWRLPCSDCWEEHEDKVHPHTLAAIYGGLKADSALNGSDHSIVLKEMRAFLLQEGVQKGHFSKWIGSGEVDASLLGLAVPYGVVEPDHPVMRATIARIESDLCQGGGVHRFAADTYYGGGKWILLTAWLGWYYTRIGRRAEALEMLKWVEGCTEQDGSLPEQVPHNLIEPSYYEPWRSKWGEIASPLLWSHAKYMILKQAVDQSTSTVKR